MSSMIRVFAKRHLPVMDIIELQGRIVITPEALAEARAAKAERQAARKAKREEQLASQIRDESENKDPQTNLAEHTNDNTINFTNNSRETKSAVSMGAGGTLPPLAPSMSGFASSSSSDNDDRYDTDSDDDDEGSLTGNGNATEDAITKSGASRSAHQQKRASSAATEDSGVVTVPIGHVEQDHLSEKRCTLCIDTLRVDGSRSAFKHPLLVLKECSARRMRQLQRHLVAQHQKAGSANSNAVTSQRAHSTSAEMEANANGSSSTRLFSEWLQDHPDALSLDSLYLDDLVPDGSKVEGITDACGDGEALLSRKRPRETDISSDVSVAHPGSSLNPISTNTTPKPSLATAYKNYELVGVVRNSVLFNSKPARVFK